MADDAAIDVHGLTKRFGDKTVVRDLSMQVRRGHIFGFLGPNGSGKTTTIRMLTGLLSPDAGEGTCLGLDIRRDTQRLRRQIGYMTQRFSLYEDLTIRENLEFVARVYGVPQPRQAADAAIERLGLEGRARQLAGQLSGGWKQRLALGACILPAPRLLLLDEPTAGVDPKARREFWDEIHKLAHEGITVLVSTHYMDEAERCHEIAYLAYGEVLSRGTVAEVIARAGLTTWMVEGQDIASLGERLRAIPEVEMVAPFGARLHVSGTDAEALERVVHQLQEAEPSFLWQRGEPTLEDVFIHLMGGSRDNFA